ncbi:MAG: helix-turn-helix domain-containing protein [Novosphingobium sp.]
MKDVGGFGAHERVMDLGEYQAAICETLDPVAIAPTHDRRQIRASLDARPLGDLVIAKAAANHSLTTCRKATVRKPEDRYFLLQLQTAGTTCIRHRGYRSECPPGTLLLMDSERQVDGEQYASSEALLLRLPEKAVRARIPGIDAFCSTPIRDSGLSQRLFTNLLFEVWDARFTLSETDLGILPRDVLHLLASTLDAAAALDATAVNRSRKLRFQRIGQYIAAHHADPDLRIDAIAQALAMSRRTICSIAQENGTTIARMIQEHRLQAVFDQLNSPACRDQTITNIAFSHGFQDSSHFSRAFKEQFGQCPSAIRRH